MTGDSDPAGPPSGPQPLPQPGPVVPALAETIALAFRVPYVGIEVEHELVGAHGEATGPVEAFDLTAAGRPLGHLLVTRPSDTVQSARERLVTAHEEERRQLRRTVCDGLEPALAGMAMQLYAARRHAAGSGRMVSILDALAGDLRSCMTEVRELVDRLWSPALDHGLASALQAECRRQNASPVVRLEVEGDLTGLPAAVEVAAHGVVADALADVARRGRARQCVVTVRRTGHLTVEIVDDGTAPHAPEYRANALKAARERVAELGGGCSVAPVAPHGTAVRVWLPVPAVESAATAAA
jgi:two-component system NarL family sensor kinase